MLDTTALLDFLAVVDAELERPIALVAVGGTALTLLGVKPSTRDVDFTAPAQDAAPRAMPYRKGPRELPR